MYCGADDAKEEQAEGELRSSRNSHSAAPTVHSPPFALPLLYQAHCGSIPRQCDEHNASSTLADMVFMHALPKQQQSAIRRGISRLLPPLARSTAAVLPVGLGYLLGVKPQSLLCVRGASVALEKRNFLFHQPSASICN